MSRNTWKDLRIRKGTRYFVTPLFDHYDPAHASRTPTYIHKLT